MVDVLTWTMERRVLLVDRAELLRKELAEIDVEVARLEAAEVVFGQYADATDSGRSRGPVLKPDAEPTPVGERVVAAAGAGGMLLVPHRTDGMAEEELPADYQTIVRVVAGMSGQVKAKDVCEAMGMDVQPKQVEPMRGKLKRLADRGWLHRTPAGRFSSR